MSLEVPLTLEPMEAEAVDELPPAGKGWQFEPKVDGFRCIIFRDGDQVHLQSRRQKPLERYFPEVADATRSIEPIRFVLDGELVIPGQPFDALQLRLHPAESRIRKLSVEIPAQFVAFDLLADAEGHSLPQPPFEERRAALEACCDGCEDIRPFYCPRQHARLLWLAMAEQCWARSGWNCREAAGSFLSARRAGDAEVQAVAHCRLRCGRHLLSVRNQVGRIPVAWTLR